MDVPLQLRPLDCDPFIHGYGEKCSEAQLTIGICDLPIVDLSSLQVQMPFYVTKGDGILLVGNEILHQSYQLGPGHLLVTPPNVGGLSSEELRFQTYTEPTSFSDRDAVRTYLFVVPSKTLSLRRFFTSMTSFSSAERRSGHMKKRFSYGKIADSFASKLHGYSHLPFEDMKNLCLRGDVMTPVIEKTHQKEARCSSCKQTERPTNSRTISFPRILGTFNTHIQLDLFFAK